MCDGAALREQSHRMMVRVEPGASSRQAGWHRRMCFQSCPSKQLQGRDFCFVRRDAACIFWTDDGGDGDAAEQTQSFIYKTKKE